MITVADLDEDDAEGLGLRERFAELQARAQEAGHSLARTRTGFMLARGSVSRHTGDLETVAKLLAGKVA